MAVESGGGAGDSDCSWSEEDDILPNYPSNSAFMKARPTRVMKRGKH